jgi:hypothetical protein
MFLLKKFTSWSIVCSSLGPRPISPLARVGIFIAANCILALVAIPFVCWKEKKGYILSIIVGLLGLISFGPHMIFTGSAGQIFLAIIVGTVLSVFLIISSIASWRKEK